MESLKQVLMRRDGLTASEADDQIADMTNDILEGADPEEVLLGVGLESDYIFDLI